MNKKLSTYLVFLFISLSYWFLTSMSKQYETTLIIPINYLDIPEEKKIINSPPSHLSIQVISHGFSLIWKEIFNIDSIPIRMTDLHKTKHTDFIKAHWVVSKTEKKIKKVLPSDMRIISASPDTVTLILQEKENKIVPVRFNGKMFFAHQYRMKNVLKLSIDSIQIFGTKDMLKRVNVVETEYIELLHIKDRIIQKLKLRHIQDISFKEEEIVIDVDVEKFTEKILKVPINVLNVPKGYRLKIYPSKINLVTTVSFDNYDKLTESLFQINVDANNIEISNNTRKNKLNITINKHPLFAKVIKIKPSSVEFILIKD